MTLILICGERASIFEKINSVTRMDAENMPSMKDSLGDFVGDKYITEIDLSKGYWQIPLAEKAKQYTAFATPQGLMQFKCICFGMKTACATFIRLMRRVLSGLNKTDCYFDNIYIHTKTFADHLVHLRNLLERLRLHGLTAGPPKCHFAYPQIERLGFMIGNDTLSMIPSRIEAISKLPPPQNKKQLRSLLGTVSFYRKFIPDMATLTSPLTKLLKKFSPNKFELDDKQLQLFNYIKCKLINAPILKLPDHSKVFYLRTDASDTGLGAMLLQKHDDILMPVAYASRLLKSAEINYSVIER